MIDSRYRQGKAISFHQFWPSTMRFQTRSFCNDKVDNETAKMSMPSYLLSKKI